MNGIRTGVTLIFLAGLSIVAGPVVAIDPAAYEAVKSAAALRASGSRVSAAPDGTIFCEGEEFQATGAAGWKARPWGENYYAATFANTFLSRKAFLGAPPQCETSSASLEINVPEAGRYLALVRYEAAYRFETRFTLKVEQAGQVKLQRAYGARENLKVWAFGNKLKSEVAWPWGAVENVVWEGHDTAVELVQGPARVTLIAEKQPEPAAKRNVDLVMFTRDEAQVKERIEKEGYLPLDGWLTQAGEVFVKVHNPGTAPTKVTLNQVQEHSPYWVHMRKWKPVVIEAPAGKSTDWIEVGSLLDTLNDAQWPLEASTPCRLEFGLRSVAGNGAAGNIEKIRELEITGKVTLVSPGDLRYTRKLLTTTEAVADLVAYLKSLPLVGKPPSLTYIMADSAIYKELEPLYGFQGVYSAGPKGRQDWRGLTAAQLEERCQKLSEAERRDILVMSLGDEIGLPVPNPATAHVGFVAFLKSRGLTPSQVNPAAGEDWSKIAYNPDVKLRDAQSGVYYWSMRYLHDYGILEQKKLTDVLRKYLPNAHIGANFSPHHGGYVHTFLGPIYQWVNCFRQDGMTLPWSEDYIWQVPVGSPQMNGISLDLFRAGLRGKPDRKILYYVMPHMPGNTPTMWRRLYYNALGHGMKIQHLFEFDPVWVAYTENHVTGNEMYATVLKTFRELSAYEDIVQSSQRRPGQVGLWFSETADIWGDNERSFAAAKRGLYVAIQGTGHALDFVVEQDAHDGTLDGYRALYLTDRHVSQAASAKIAAWVNQGGRLFATAGAGMYDEYHRPNKALRELLGVDESELLAPEAAQISFIKQDLPFAKPLDAAKFAIDGREATLPALGVKSRVTLRGAEAFAKFDDGAPAATRHKVGRGTATYCALLPSLAYFQPAIPLQPLDRGSTDDAMAHLIPTEFDAVAGALIAQPTSDLKRTVTSSAPLVETSVLESATGLVIPVQNWCGKAILGLKLTLSIPLPGKQVSLASGGKVELKSEGDAAVVEFDLDIAGDVLVIR